ncbi:hypothetical protein K439DRAFT_1612698 [Ramaria rubella]|nr:hypothetical protein K439DRAFT_1612698 [Ramaria rubella]
MFEFALSPMTRTILIYAGWFTLPGWATNITVHLYHRILSYFDPKYTPPSKGSARAAGIWRYCYAFVMISYLVTTTIHSSLSMPLNFYEILGIGPDADDQDLKVAFRNFARRNHPDRVGPGGAPLFIAVRDAYEALNHPVKRFAYDRFGPDAMTWKDCATPREYLRHGLIASSGFYIGIIIFLIVWSVLGTHNTGAYWRNLLLCTLFFLEFSLIVNSSPDNAGNYSFFPFSIAFRHRVPYQHTLFLHQLYMSLSIAISRVIPILLPESSKSSRAVDHTMSAVKPIIEKLAFLATTADHEVSRMLFAEIRSAHGSSALRSEPAFVYSDKTIAALTAEMEDLIIDKQLQSHPLLRGYWDAAIARRHQETDLRPEHSQTLTLPSPPQSLSPVEPSKESSPVGLERVAHNIKPASNFIELPSPRPSPPRELGANQPAGVATSTKYVRGRSHSY